MRNSDLDTIGLEMTVVTATDGRQAQMPTKFLKNYNQKMIDCMIMQLFRGSVLDLATCRAVGLSRIEA
ncbi:hypothetical protein [Mycobacteroides abscessus]|uniref:hypothetical protein n=1 Tax=Mycobacteroides abscessus TaxID=36809 RepID=UPI000929E1F5|nr:hypothetical protein [Mycobacteroides abscessus]DAZ90376.1 TPA_asm: hypothetical protein PROPHIFSQJ01-1_90 [Mycobacterium phage prophiFSQJ01-1]SII41935.1 Uncharacterised protein [Mycobacteroides abscessus subsp. abscessus]SIK13118.1 Uncharacterised protein [Mycobacteroides abscessus subsp. abscessus]SIN26008.1 Uncharacterised protein [Mycobacteroides abscessus subsp. abscessus]SLI50955.1 Uncharacterised protein [Mycobacteroides abscessus subsp. abscessus]